MARQVTRGNKRQARTRIGRYLRGTDATLIGTGTALAVKVTVCVCAVKFEPRITFPRAFCVRYPEERLYMARSNVVAISERFASSKKSTAQASIVDKPVGDACLSDWKRFCFVLREIASGDNGRPLSGTEAQQRAQAVLTECGYTWPGRGQACEPAVVRIIAPESPKTQAPVQSSTGTKLKRSITAQSRSGRRIDPHPRERGVGASLNGSPA